MLLRSIKLKNFRQFKDDNYLEFSVDQNKNVSIILGENGSGKTSLAEAFTWCLYGLTDFSDPIMLNKSRAATMFSGDKEEVTVEVQLVHNDSQFNIRRFQQYRKKPDGSIEGKPTTLSIAKKANGQQEFLKNPDLEIKQILPKELAGYFFLNGEHIQKLTKELKKGKSKEFANAVENLLGLNAFLEAIEHLKPSKKYSVIGCYNDQFDGGGNKEITTLKNLVENKQAEKSKVETKIEEVITEIDAGRESCEGLEQTIRENEKSALYQSKVDVLNSKIANLKNQKTQETKQLLKTFNLYGLPFFAKSLVNGSLEFLTNEKIADKGIPSIHKQTIDFLINRGHCICGTEIKPGEEIHTHLLELLNYIPPKSIGLLVQDFISQAESLVKRGDTFFDTFETQFAHIRSYQNDIDEHISEIEEIKKLLVGLKDVGVYQSRLSAETTRLKSLEDQLASLNRELGGLENELARYESRLSTLALQDEKNRKIETYKAYAQEIYDRLTYSYDKEENRVRQLLQESVNKIFREIYEGGMSISIDEKYRITVNVDEIEGVSSEVETSTAQSTSVIFAFIAGIIELAKNFSNAQGQAQELLAASEPYPLVMDAPLSNFDTRRIKTVCDTLPKVAEQVIIMIKDTDGELASQHMGSIIGKSYRLEKRSELETVILLGI